MYSNIEKITPKYEQRIRELLEQIREFKTQISQYKTLLEDKDYHITLLYNENLELKAQLQNLQKPAIPGTAYTPQSHQTSPTQIAQITPPPKMSPPKMSPPKQIESTMKRQCPNCGASGFAIREIEDKTQIISYVPRRIYAKKKLCTKCSYEF
ncbi:MAG: hypothetical protein ACFFDK_09310 [Promethearchaeota archaeon]